MVETRAPKGRRKIKRMVLTSMEALTDIRFEVKDGVALITLNRPERLNALLLNTIAEINLALDAVEYDEALRAVIITGAPRPDGRPCFSAGLDLREIAEKGVPALTRPGNLGAVEGMAALESIENPFMQLCDRLESFPRPTIAAVDGVCTGGGLEVALCCDLRIVAETAQISDLHIKNLGVIGGGGATVRLTHLVGPAKAKEIVFFGEPINGSEAWRIGLANRVAPAAKLQEEAQAWGAKLAALSASGLRLAKASINASVDMATRDALRYSYICWAMALGDATQRAKDFTSGRGDKK